MPIQDCRRPGAASLGAALFLSLVVAAPASAQDGAVAGKVGRSWTDPPARGNAAVPGSEVSKVGERTRAIGGSRTSGEISAASSNGAPERAPKPIDQAASDSTPRVAKDSPESLSHAPSGKEARRANVRIASRNVDKPQRRLHAIAVVRPPIASRNRRVRVVTVRRPAPFAADAPAPRIRYGYAEAVPPEPDFGGTFEDDRSRRIREARAAGYILVRTRTRSLPDGRRVQSFRPYDRDDFED